MNAIMHWINNKNQALGLAEDRAVQYVEDAFHGDIEATEKLIFALGSSNRGEFSVLMYRARIDREAYRVFLEEAWNHDHDHVVSAAGARKTLKAMFKYAQFGIPESLGETMRVWRGTHGISIKDALRGPSWTTDKATACDFAITRANGRNPLVIVADVPRAAILHYTDEIGEQEAVVFDVPIAKVDGDAQEWAILQADVRARIRANNKAHLSQNRET